MIWHKENVQCTFEERKEEESSEGESPRGQEEGRKEEKKMNDTILSKAQKPLLKLLFIGT